MKKILGVLALAAMFSFTAKAQYENTTIQVGKPAPELAFNNPDGKTLSLKEIAKGRYVLVDFWASWCGPCRMSSPELVKTYNKYKDRKFKNAKNGFTVYSVSLDKNKEAWIAAMKKDGYVWPNHVSDLQGWQSEAATAWGIQFIPQAFLVGPDGNIVAKFADVRQAEATIAKYATN